MSGTALERRSFYVEGPAGRLEALLESARGKEPVAVASVCHPHPLYRGTLNNKVTFTLARAAVDCGAAALRFNFRGVGASAGEYGGGRGEVGDLTACEQWLVRRFPGLPRWRLGFSFGAAVAIAASRARPCSALVTVAPPVSHLSEYGVEDGAPRADRWLLVQGDRDEIVDPSAVLDWARRCDPKPELRVLRGAGHFFHGRLGELRASVSSMLETAAGGGDPG